VSVYAVDTRGIKESRRESLCMGQTILGSTMLHGAYLLFLCLLWMISPVLGAVTLYTSSLMTPPACPSASRILAVAEENVFVDRDVTRQSYQSFCD